MDKYTILLVDDEEEVIQAIIRKINWEELGFSVVGYAIMESRRWNDRGESAGCCYDRY